MSSSAVSGSSKSPRILACVLCQHRKIKCDRNTPCSNCLKANVTCTPSIPAPARKRRRPNQDLQERLARCEELLKSYASTSAPDAPASSSNPPSASPVSAHETPTHPKDQLPSWVPPGKIVVEDGSTRFMDSYIWTSVYDELQAMRKIVDSGEMTEDRSMLTTESATPDETSDFLMGDYANLSLEDVQPDPLHIVRLWQVFLDRVNPVTKVIHVPSVQPRVFDAASNFNKVPTIYRALLFAIFNMAIVSLKETECQKMLGMGKEDAQKKFSVGIRAALVQANFMRTYDLVILQALVLYSMSLQSRSNRHALWIFSGICVRIAQKMGLHRDGELLKLAQYETEMRRRVWWQIMLLDAKYASLSGLSQTVTKIGDVKLPSNLNDADLFPGSTEWVQPREGATEMGFCLLSYEIGLFMIECHRFPGFEAAILGTDGNMGETQETLDFEAEVSHKFRELVDEFEQRLCGIQDKYIDANAGPIHEVAVQIPRLVMWRLRDFLVPMRERPEYGSEVFGFKDNLFRVVIASCEKNLEVYRVLDAKDLVWYCKLNFPLDIIVVMAWSLSKRTRGKMVERAWAAINEMYVFNEEYLDMTQKAHVSLGAILLKAWRAREKALWEDGVPIEVPRFIGELKELLPGASDGRSSTYGLTPESGSSADPVSKEDQPGASDPSLDQFLGGYLDVSVLDWDMWGEVSNNPEGQAPQGMGGFGSMGGFGPPKW